MNATDAAHAFSDLFGAVYRHAYRRRNPRAARVSGEALAMLQHLRDSGPLTVGEAARHFGLSQSSVSERIQRLVRRGLIETIPDRRDRRRHLTWLTRDGEDLLRRELEALSPEVLLAIMSRMEPKDRENLIRAMRTLLHAARQHTREKRRE